jgi:hypothetical protein
MSRMENLIEANRQAARGFLKDEGKLLSFVVGWDEKTKGQGWLMATPKGLVYYYQTGTGPKREFFPYHRVKKVALMDLLIFIRVKMEWDGGVVRVGGINRACPYGEFVALVREQIAAG